MTGRIFLACALATCVSVVGCSSSSDDRPETVPAEGVVTYKGQPLADATVTLTPVGGKYAASGKTDAEGHFTLRAFADKEGVVPGEYRVAIQKREEGVDVGADAGPEAYKSKSQVAKSLIPEKYANPNTSGLSVTIPDGGKTDIRFDLN